MRLGSKLLLRLLQLARPRPKPSRHAWCVRVCICSIVHLLTNMKPRLSSQQRTTSYASHRQVMHTQLAEEQQLRQAAEQGCTAAQAEALAAGRAAADDQRAAEAAVTEAEQRAAAAAKAMKRADTAAAVAAAQRQQAEQASDLFQRRLHEVQTQLRMQQQQQRNLAEQLAKVCTCLPIMSVYSLRYSHASAVQVMDWSMGALHLRVPVQAETHATNVQSEAHTQLAQCRDEAAAAKQQCEKAAAVEVAKAGATIAELVQQGQRAVDEVDGMRKELKQVEERAAAAAEEHEVGGAGVLQRQGKIAWLLPAANGMSGFASHSRVHCRLQCEHAQLSAIAWWLRPARPSVLLRMKLQFVKQACSCSCNM